MRIERPDRRRDLLLIGALFVGGFGLTTLVIWPKTEDQAPHAAPLIKLDQMGAISGVEAASGSSEAQLAKEEALELSVLPAATLQELAVDSDADTRDEAQALLALLSEEAVVDQQL